MRVIAERRVVAKPARGHIIAAVLLEQTQKSYPMSCLAGLRFSHQISKDGPKIESGCKAAAENVSLTGQTDLMNKARFIR